LCFHRIEEAVECYDKAHNINPNHAETWKEKASALCELKHFPQAIYCYEKALAIDPKSATAWHNMGWAYTNINKLDDALRCYDHALKLNPKHTNSMSNRKRILQLLNKGQAPNGTQIQSQALKKTSSGHDVHLGNSATFKFDIIVQCNNTTKALQFYGSTINHLIEFIKTVFSIPAQDIQLEYYHIQSQEFILLDYITTLFDGIQIKVVDTSPGVNDVISDEQIALLFKKITELELELEEKRKEIQDLQDRNICCVCMDNQINTVFLDCAHIAVCIICANDLRKCPLCSSPILKVVQTYHS